MCTVRSFSLLLEKVSLLLLKTLEKSFQVSKICPKLVAVLPNCIGYWIFCHESPLDKMLDRPLSPRHRSAARCRSRAIPNEEHTVACIPSDNEVGNIIGGASSSLMTGL